MPKYIKTTNAEAICCRDAMAAFSAGKAAYAALPAWLRDAHEKGRVMITPAGLHVPTPDGTQLAGSDDWIAWEGGVMHPVKPDVFVADYRPAPDSE